MSNLSIPKAAYWHALNLITNGNSAKFGKSARFLGGPNTLFGSNENQLLQAGLDPSAVNLIIAGRKSINPEVEWDRLTKMKISAVCMDDPDYPKKLAQISSPPPLLYIRGNIAVLNQHGLAVVGSRKISSYGKQAVDTIIPPLVDTGLNIISGMAIGVDGAALSSCIKRGGTPIGVLASSLADKEIAPEVNYHLACEIMEAGCLVSENPPGTKIYKAHFPMRNRIVSGLSLGVLIIEATLKSGSLITANLALEQNREVFAVPGSIFSFASAGTLDLIKRGAKCVTSAKDIVQEFGWDVEVSKEKIKNLKPKHKQIHQLISRSSCNAEHLIKEAKISAGDLMVVLTELELSGLIKKTSDGNYVRIK
jgi:DNA processing protein